MRKRTGLAQGMNASQYPAQRQQLVEVIEIRGVAALTGVKGETKALVFAQGVAFDIG